MNERMEQKEVELSRLMFSYPGEMKDREARGSLYKNRNSVGENKMKEVVSLQLVLCYAIEEWRDLSIRQRF